MNFRRQILPRHPLEILACLVIVGLVPLVLLYDIIVVLPTFHAKDTFLYKFTLFMDIFLLFNLESNFLACLLIDTEVDHKRFKDADGNVERLDWHFCKCCDSLVPPRSWHCKCCDVCILKRDHHCGFTGYCIGHRNQRYFMCFLLYLFALTTYNGVYNAFYMYKYGDFVSNVLLFYVQPGKNFICVPVANFGLAVTGVCLSGCLFINNLLTLLRGETTFQSDDFSKYDLGVYNNLRGVFGQRMHLAWLCPFIKSELPDDGYSWKTNSTEMQTKPN